jgi:hypothetical protein
VVQYIAKADRKGSAVVRVGIGSLVVGVVMTLLFLNRPAVEGHIDVEHTDMEQVSELFVGLATGELSGPILEDLLKTRQELVKQGLKEGRIRPDQQMVQRLGESGLAEAIPLLRLICDNIEDPWVRYYGSFSLLQLGDEEGVHRLIQALKDPGPVFLKVTVNEFLLRITGEEFGYQPMSGAEKNQNAIHRWESWWHENAEKVIWDFELGQLRLR